MSVFDPTNGPARDQVKQTGCHIIGHLWPSVSPKAGDRCRRCGARRQ